MNPKTLPSLTLSLLTSLVLSCCLGCGTSTKAPSSTTTTPPTQPTPPTPTASNTNQWTWTGGSSSTGQPGVYGTLGTAAAGNVPGAREFSISWSDSSGNALLFGGYGADATGTVGNLNDMWLYSPANSTWQWIAGANAINSAGSYGTMGTPSASNIPSARGKSVLWTAGDGTIWLFGGLQYTSTGVRNHLADLWHYIPANGTWTWVSGTATTNTAGAYGTMGTASAANTPGARSFAVGWPDSQGNLWLFGGLGIDGSGNLGALNDLWKFNIANNTWTWVSGSNTVDTQGVYGTQGTAASANTPGARYGSVNWIDTNGKFWLLGGGTDIPNCCVENSDLWEFDPLVGKWTWMNGADTSGAPAVYGNVGTAATANTPGARLQAMSWKDNQGNIWLFGGYGPAGDLSDLWEYNPGASTWTWMGGPSTANQAGAYGTLSIAAASNVPGSRISGITWVDSQGNLLLFGGKGYGSSSASFSYLNDLWSYQP